MKTTEEIIKTTTKEIYKIFFKENAPVVEGYKNGNHEELKNLLRSTITSIQREMIEKIIELVQQNHKGTFTDDGGNDCWYIDDLVKALEHYKDSLQSPVKKEGQG